MPTLVTMVIVTMMKATKMTMLSTGLPASESEAARKLMFMALPYAVLVSAMEPVRSRRSRMASARGSSSRSAYFTYA